MGSLIHKTARTEAINWSVQKLLRKSTLKTISFHLPVPSEEVVSIFVNVHIISSSISSSISTVVGSSFL